MPLVTVIVPTWNSGRYIMETLECISQQSYANFELIIVDDGSTDNTATLISGLSDRMIVYPFPKYY